MSHRTHPKALPRNIKTKNPYIHHKGTSNKTNLRHQNPYSKIHNNTTEDKPHHHQWMGTPIPPRHDIFTIGFSNINGLKTDAKTPLNTSLRDLVSTLNYYDISLFGMSEHHVALKNPGVAEKIHKFERTTRPTLPTKCFLHSSQETTTDNRRLMGGTGLIVLQNTIGRLRPKGHGGDNMGRWSYVQLQRTNNRILTVVSIYQVCQSPTNKIGGTAWHQQRRALDQQQRNDEHPRDAFMKDLKRLLKTLKNQSHDLIVGGDWNDAILNTRSKLLSLCTELGLVDPWLHFHPNHDKFATHERGSDRIDSIFVSQPLLQTIETISYSPVGMIHNNDHRTILLQLSTSKYSEISTCLFRGYKYETYNRMINSQSRPMWKQCTTI